MGPWAFDCVFKESARSAPSPWIGIKTVRSQLKSLYQKMGVKKQQDVIRILLSGVMQIN